jgi:hypothetical protein
MAVAKVIKRTLDKTRKNPKTAKQTRAVNPYSQVLPKNEAKKKFKNRPMRRTVTRGKQALQKSEVANKPLRTIKTRYGGR